MFTYLVKDITSTNSTARAFYNAQSVGIFLMGRALSVYCILKMTGDKLIRINGETLSSDVAEMAHQLEVA